MKSGTTSIIDHYGDSRELRVHWGTVNGWPISMPMGTRAVTITVSSEWLKANPPKPSK